MTNEASSVSSLFYAHHGPIVGATAAAILLHGLGHDEAIAWEMMSPAIPSTVMTRSARGRLAMPGRDQGRAWFHVDFALDHAPRPNLEQEAASRAQVVALAEDIRHQPAFRDKPLMLIGFGQGGVLALGCLLHRPDLFDGVAEASGRLMPSVAQDYPPAAAHIGKPLFWGHGRADPVLAFAGAQHGRAALAPCRLVAAFVDHDGGHEATAELLIALKAWLTASLSNATGNR